MVSDISFPEFQVVLFLVLEIDSHSVAQAGHKFMVILLPHLSEVLELDV